MKKIIFLFLLVITVIFNLARIGHTQQTPKQIFQAGLYSEEIQGDLEKAISCFKEIIENYSGNRPLSANAWLHIGFCYEKMGQQKAREAYQKIIEQYSDQREIAAIARLRLKNSEIKNQKSEIKIDPLVKYYFERLGVDITTAYSWNGNYLAYTDWTNGNIYIKNLATGGKRKLTQVDWANVDEYAYHPQWSRDDQYIAYSYYRQPYFIELRVVSMADGKGRVVFSDPDLMIFPQDWTPGSNLILCETYNFNRETENWLAFISVDSLELKDIVSLSRNSLGMKVSPDGNYLTYDMLFAEARYIFLMSLMDFQKTVVGEGLPGVGGFDSPVWSSDGKCILCRNSGNFDLWAIPIHNGKQSQRAFLVQHDISQALLSIKAIDHQREINVKKIKTRPTVHRERSNSAFVFEDDFSSLQLDSAWSVFEWARPNVYDYPSFGRYSLMDHPGHLRYYLDPAMTFGHRQQYTPLFSGWYWLYPSLEISRPIAGDHWVLETKVSFSMVDGANGRMFVLMIVFDAESQRNNYLVIKKNKDINPVRRGIDLQMYHQDVVIDKVEGYTSPKDIPGTKEVSYCYRISRLNQSIRVEIGEDEKHYQIVFNGDLPPELNGLMQEIILTGDSWFVPAGSYADWDYIRFNILDR